MKWKQNKYKNIKEDTSEEIWEKNLEVEFLGSSIIFFLSMLYWQTVWIQFPLDDWDIYYSIVNSLYVGLSTTCISFNFHKYLLWFCIRFPSNNNYQVYIKETKGKERTDTNGLLSCWAWD